MPRINMRQLRNKLIQPVIVNSASNFVVVTYWWGRGNLNKNTQRPCPDELSPDESPTELPITFNKMIARWKSNCRKHKCNYMAVEYPEFVQKGAYQQAINFKPIFIEEALKACGPRGVLYIDGDMLLKRYPKIFDIPNVDYMAQGWNVDPRMDPEASGFCYNPYVFETSGGTMFFADSVASKHLLKVWSQKTRAYPGKADDRLISQVFNNTHSLLTTSTIQLPIEYLWFTMDYPVELRKTSWDSRYIVIEHPECLTDEDRAASLGANPERLPPRYDAQITNQVSCRLKSLPLYEYIFFPSKRFVNSMGKYLGWMRSHKVIKVIPYNRKYGKYNKNYKKNQLMMKELGLSKYTTGTVYITRKKIVGLHKQVHLNRKKDLISLILLYLKKGVNVIYVPEASNKKSVTHVRNIARKEHLDFVCRNTNKSSPRYKKEFTLKINKEYPMFFSADNEVLSHLLNMSNTLTQMESHFNTSFGFISRIRCFWV